jgi:hypothetical protein
VTSHDTHTDHTHVHGEACGHLRVAHGDHHDYLHDGHLHSEHGDHYDEHVLAVSETNPAACAPVSCGCDHAGCEHQAVPHGDHTDRLVDGRLHHRHDGHCDDHGPLAA